MGAQARALLPELSLETYERRQGQGQDEAPQGVIFVHRTLTKFYPGAARTPSILLTARPQGVRHYGITN